MVKEVNSSNFDESITGSKVTVIDFWAEWCNPCKMFKKTFHEVSDENDDVNFLACDADENEELCEKFSIRNLPTIVFIKDGAVVNRLTGAISKDKFVETIKELCNEDKE